MSSMQFCPVDGTMLLVHVDAADGLRWLCPTCPYMHCPRTTQRVEQPLVQKQVDDVLGGDNARKDVDQTELRCEQCGHNRAYYIQMQTRSADEPMTVLIARADSTRTRGLPHQQEYRYRYDQLIV